MKQLHFALGGVLRRNHFETFVGAGRCLCYLLLNCSLHVMMEVVDQVFIYDEMSRISQVSTFGS
jgi:hypothetical protein